MKLKKGVQGVLVFIAVISFILIACTIDSEWSLFYLLFLLINTAMFFASVLILKKYGRWNDEVRNSKR